MTQLTYSQEKQKRVSIPNINPQIIEELHHLGVDMTCGVSITDDMTLELNEHQLHELEHHNIKYNVLIEDMTKFYSERAIKYLPEATALIKKEKALKRRKKSSSKGKTSKSITIKELTNNVGQYDECDEIDWDVPDNWNLNDADSYPNETNHFGGCLTYDMVKQELDDMKALYPHLISKKKNASPTNQLTKEGRTMWMVRISDNPEVDEPAEPETLYQSLIHSREAATVMNQLYFMWYLLENYDSDPAIKNLVNNHALYFIPVFNPDGFVYNQTVAPNGGGGQRKNRNFTGGCGTYDNGIDLNRNSAYYWGNGGASTTDGCSATYAGSGPFSENETQIMRDFVYEHDFKLALNHHSYKNAMLHAYAGTSIENPRPDEYSKYNHDMTFYNRYAHGPSTSISGLNSGNMNDWMLGGPAGVSANGTPTGIGSGKHTLSWTPENGLFSEGAGGPGGSYSGFWPNPINYLPIAKRAMRMNLLAAYFSGKYAKLHDLSQTDITNTTGSLQFGIENLGQNGNDATPSTNAFTVTVTAITPNITINTTSASQNFTAEEILTQKTVDINYTLDPSIAANDEIKFKVVLTNDNASSNILYEVNITKIFNPTVISTLDPTNFSNWTSSGSWSAVTDGFNDASAIRSNATIPYATNQNRTLQYDGSFNLNGMQSAIVQFYAKWDLERSYDFVVIEGSTNGSSWTELCGRLTKPGAPTANNSYSSTTSGGESANKSSTDDARQNGISALYDGDTQDRWSMEEIVIDASTNSFLYNQNTVFLRFRLRTDSSNRRDSYKNVDFEGFTFDDFKVIAAGCVTSKPTNVLASKETTNAATLNWDEVFNNSYDLRYRINGSSSWTNINNINENTREISGLTVGTTYDFQVRSQCGSSSNSEYSDTITFTTLACSAPTNVTATDVGLSTARIYWNEIPNATYDVRYSLNGSNSWTSTAGTGLVLDQPVYNISGLNEATEYKVQVRTNCPGGGNSSYSTSTIFTTLGCVAPNNVSVSEIFINGANVIWDSAGDTTYDLRYRVSPSGGWSNISNINTNALNVSNLAPNTTYDLQVRTDCNSSSSAYSTVINFTTASCSTPTNVTADDISASSATINWDDIEGSDFDLRYRATSSSTWINVNDRALNFYNIPNLIAGTEYEVQVRTVCNSSTNSAYSVLTIFNTLNCNTIIDTFPYSESFESNLGDWNQANINEIDWTRFSGLTPSNTGNNPANTTGPSTASNGSYYLYTESSGSNNNKKAYLLSPCFDLNGYQNATLNFDYHMFGANMGSLSLEVSTDNGNTYTPLFSRTGNHPDQNANADSWITQPVDLSAYDGSVIRLRFYGLTGSNYTSDISIDNIVLTANTVSSFTPIASCKNINVTLDETGNASIIANDIDEGSSVGDLSIDISNFTCADIGTNNITLTATDPNDSNNTDSCVATVTVTRQDAPASTNCWDNYQYNTTSCTWVNNGSQPAEPTATNCWDDYQFNTTSCAWVNNGSQPEEPTATNCWDDYQFNTTSCAWVNNGSQPEEPTATNCWDDYQFNTTSCAWVNNGSQPEEPTATNCWDDYQFNTTSCTWVNNGSQPEEPTATNCWDDYQFNTTSCAWVNNGSQPAEPTATNCWDDYQFNTTSCAWVNNGSQPEEPTATNCWDDYQFNTTSCAWVNNGSQPEEPTATNCWDDYQFNTTSCAWVNNGSQPEEPTATNCWDDYQFNTTSCAWVNNGSQPEEPTATNCWDDYQFNTTSCAWVNNGSQPEEPTATNCWDDYQFNTTSCAWVNNGSQPEEPTATNCWDDYQFNTTSCAWVNNGSQPEEPTATNCWDDYQFNTTSCTWENNGSQPEEPTATNCWDDYQFNTTSCAWANNGSQPEEPTATNCWDDYQFNTTSCAWENNGSQPAEPTATNCWDDYQFNTTSCTWENNGSQPEEPTATNCWDDYQFNTTSCAWENNGSQPAEPTATNCWDDYQFNTTSCAWENNGSQPEEPTATNCWDDYQFNTTSCAWENNGSQPEEPTATNCWDDYQFNTASCTWQNNGSQPAEPTATNCWDDYQFNTTSCTWENNGSQPAEPTATNCWDDYQFNTASCTWENNGSQPAEPTATNCWDDYQFNTTSCAWENNGSQPEEPTATNCWDDYQFNTTSCTWVNNGSQPEEPATECYETATFNDTTCSWDITNNGSGITYYMDSDKDGFGDLNNSIMACSIPTGYVYNNTDCDDTDNTIYPGAPEVANDGIDQDCNGSDETTLQIEAPKLNTLSIAPNPFNNNVTIKVPSNFNNHSFNVQIFDLNGRLVFSKIYSSINNTIDVHGLDNLEQAPYLIKIVDQKINSITIKKIIKY
ncbi:hypothetical protein GCM10022291_23830 [Postechiella marina]|uniref:Uncharacterized protein n=2 Tax=Postechiella marina TaxID=943941 RepID=A0ABP8CBX6_9FLAO